jgi:hypothetical protein
MFNVLTLRGDEWTTFTAGFKDPQEAAAHARHMSSITGGRFRVQRVGDDNWREREGRRARHPFAETLGYKFSEYSDLHFLHYSKTGSHKIAFTLSDEHGRQDRQTRMTFRAYLNRFFEDMPDTEKELMVSKFDDSSLEILRDSSEIVSAYTKGPPSCMSHGVCSFQSSVHPVRVFGGESDIKLAVMRSGEGDIIARALVWPEKGHHARIYAQNGGINDHMKQSLAESGYKPGSFDGARLNRIEDSGDCFVMPYLDRTDTDRWPCAASVDDDGDFMIWQDTGGEYNADSTTGLCGEDSCYSCENCGDRVHEDYIMSTERGEVMCGECYSEIYTCCDDCDEMTRREELTYTANQGAVCEGCIQDYVYCDECGEWYRAEDTGPRDDGSDICENCADSLDLVRDDDGVYCEKENEDA